MPAISIWIHLIWTTKNRQPFIPKSYQRKIFQHIRDNARAKGINLVFINGTANHVHTLIQLKANQNISDVAKLLKGESSYWINRHKLTKTTFEWQDDYIAISIHKVQVKRVIEYIRNQQIHHQIKRFS